MPISLQKQLMRLRERSWRDPRVGNPLGLKIQLRKRAAFCTNHVTESEVRPRGVQQGWPSTIDFLSVPNRILRHYDALLSVALNPGSSKYYVKLSKAISKDGIRKTLSARGSYGTYDDGGPG